MRFINRKKELQFVEESYQLSKRKLFSLVVYGLRRIGKTRLIQESIKKGGLYFFITKNKTSSSLLREFEGILKENKIITDLESLTDWDSFFKTLFERYEGTVAFDEFQNFNGIDKSIYGILQKYIDLNEKKKNLLLIFSGSTIGLIKKIFYDNKESLYGRVKRKLFLKPLNQSSIIEMCKELNIKNIEEIVKLYSIFGGFPKYYVAIEDENLEGKSFEDILEELFFRENAVLEDEVERILALEFGKRKGRYYDILTAIADGENTISKISSFLSKKESKITRYLNELLYYFEIISQEKQVIGNKKIFVIKNPIMNFWFSLFYKNLSAYKSRRSSFIEQKKKDINIYIGRQFETFCREFLLSRQIFKFDEIGKQWGKFKGEKGKNVYEIDIVALNKNTKEILFGECKWKDNINAEKVLQELKEKSKFVDWNKEKRKDSYAIFAKSFKKRTKDCCCFDLKDIFKQLRSSKTKTKK